MIRLVASDVDGVLYIRGSLVTRTLTLIKQLQDSGICCTVITGMGVKRIHHKLSSFHANCPMVIEDGGRIVTPNGETIVEYPLPETEIIKLAHFLPTSRVSMAAFSCLDDNQYVCLVNDIEGERMVKSGLEAGAIRQITNDVSLFLGLALRHGCTRVTVKPREGCSFEPPSTLRCAQNEYWYNLTAQGVDKGTALVKLCDLLAVPLHETLVIGNDYNDIPMFKQPIRYKIAVGSYSTELTALASHHVESPEQVSDTLAEIFRTHLVRWRTPEG